MHPTGSSPLPICSYFLPKQKSLPILSTYNTCRTTFCLLIGPTQRLPCVCSSLFLSKYYYYCFYININSTMTYTSYNISIFEPCLYSEVLCSAILYSAVMYSAVENMYLLLGQYYSSNTFRTDEANCIPAIIPVVATIPLALLLYPPFFGGGIGGRS